MRKSHYKKGSNPGRLRLIRVGQYDCGGWAMPCCIVKIVSVSTHR